MGRDEMRAGDADRKVVADQLKTALDEGRLDLTEYDERIQRAYGAKTFGDLNGLLDDLPGTAPPAKSQLQPAAAPAPVPQRVTGGQVARWVGPYGGVFVVCVLIWAITSTAAGHLTYFWPVWLLIPLVLGVFGQWFGHDASARNARRGDRRDR